MNRSAISRGAPIARTGDLFRFTPLERQTPLRQVGERRARSSDAELDFILAIRARADRHCERCHRYSRRIHAHHIVPRSRAPGWSGLHDPSNGAGLCPACHDAIHAHTVDDWSDWLRAAPEVLA